MSGWPAVRLGVALAGASVLMLVAGWARPEAGSAEEAREAARRAVLPEARCGVFVRSVFVAGPADTLVYYRGYRSPDTTGLVGYTVGARGRGYSGTIETVAGVDLSGRIRGIRVVSHKETQGLGSKIAEVKPVKTFVDALRANAGRTASGRVIVELGSSPSANKCLEVQVKDTTLCLALDKAVAGRDTAAIMDLASKALDLGAGQDTLLEDRAAVVEVAEGFVGSVRGGQTPWWQVQFQGKTAADLVLAKQQGATSIQGITGATVSTRAVTESVKNAIVRLGEAVGGFKEAKR